MRISKIQWLLIGFIACLIFLSLTSCRVFKPREFCSEHYPPQISDSVTTEIKYVHDTLRIPVPYEDISFDTTTSIDPSIVFHKEIKKGRVSGYLDINKGKVTFKCIADSLQIVVDVLKKEITVLEKRTKVVHDPCDKEHKTKWNYFATYFTWIGLVLIAIGLAFKMLKKG